MDYAIVLQQLEAGKLSAGSLTSNERSEMIEYVKELIEADDGGTMWALEEALAELEFYDGGNDDS